MDFSKNWIGEFVDLPETREMADRLTGAGLSVEGIEESGGDVLLEIDVTTNRPDCMNHFGLARELSAILDRELRAPEVRLATSSDAASSAARLEIEEPALCPRYTALVLRGVRVGPSPRWLAERLEAIGSRSINNVVDITNYVLWETGQPLHAFDLEKISAAEDGRAEVRVRRAGEGEKLKTLDGEERELDPSILVIADAERAIALAGVMGGFDSEVTESTTDVLLESAHFDPITVRKGAKKLGLHTDASHRFERGADPEACLSAARRAASLILELAGGELLEGALEVSRLHAEWPPRVDIEVGRLERFGGLEIGAERVEGILERLGFGVERLESDSEVHPLRVTVPSWRYFDFEGIHAQDVYEEVLRVHGFDRIAATLPSVGGPDAPESPVVARRRTVQNTLAAAGFAETINFAFLAREADDAYPSFFADREAMELANALSDLYAVMRRSLLPNLVDTARYNQRRGLPAVRVFEVGRIFAASAGEEGRVEMETVALVLGGQLGTPWEHQAELDFFDLKGAVEALAEAVGRGLTYRPASPPAMRAGSTAEILLAGDEEVVVGVLGELDDRGLAYPLFAAEISLDLLGERVLSLETRAPSRQPGIEVDLTLTHRLDVPWREIERAVEETGVSDLVRFGLKDRYTGDGVPEGAVNTTLTFYYNADDRSLTQDEVNARQDAITARLAERFAWQAAGQEAGS
ncbi:MAG: phenylalanine--tRNA ligase subunit beta [Acidobacteriota bacterium]